MSPALPAPCVVTEIFAPSLMAKDGVVTVIRPAFPGLAVVLKIPLAAPARAIDPFAVIVTFPPAPTLVGSMFVVLLWIWPPFVTLNVLSTVTTMSPALPKPCVVTDIFAPSLSARDGVVTVIRPAFPGLSVVLKTPLAAPARVTDSFAVIVTLPPVPPTARLVFVVLLWIWPPFVTLNVLPSVATMSPAAPPPCVVTDIFAPSPSVRGGVVTVIVPAFPLLLVVLTTPLAAPARDTD